MHICRLGDQTLNLEYLVRAARLDGPHLMLRVIMARGVACVVEGDHAAKLMARLDRLDREAEGAPPAHGPPSVRPIGPAAPRATGTDPAAAKAKAPGRKRPDPRR